MYLDVRVGRIRAWDHACAARCWILSRKADSNLESDKEVMPVYSSHVETYLRMRPRTGQQILNAITTGMIERAAIMSVTMMSISAH